MALDLGDAAGGGGGPDRRSTLRAWRERLAGRADSEHEQVLIRLGIAVGALVYLASASVFAGEAAALAARCLPLGVAYVACSAALVAHLLWRPEPWPARRYAGMVLDMLALTLVLTLGERAAAIFYPFYLWITLGMGFRYGLQYLYVSAVLSLASFALVVAVTDYWRDQLALSAALWCALLGLPAYASSLLAKLTDALARAETASRTKSRFLATMSHELRTPLNAVIGMADLLGASRLDEEQRDMVRTVRSAGKTLLDMIDDILDVARVESGKTAVAEVEFDFHQLLATVRALLDHEATSKGLALRLAVDPAIPSRLRGPARFLQQILTNLVANGIKFTDRGGVTIRCQAVEIGDRVVVRTEVRDTGIGIPPDAQELIFDQFTQADDSTTRRYGGTGLGLAIARQLAGLMHGTLEVSSAPGSGATFTLTVPFARPEAQPERLDGTVVVVGEARTAETWRARVVALGARCRIARTVSEARRLLGPVGGERALLVVANAPPDALASSLVGESVNQILVGQRADEAPPGCLAVLPPDASDRHLFNALHAALASPETSDLEVASSRVERTRRRILVAEDNRVNQKVIGRILEHGGHAVTVVDHGEAALDALERDSFDVALMDLNMPVMGGLEAVKMHRFMHGGDGTVRFVALTADVTDETRAACADAGITEYVTKPVETAELLSLIDHLWQPAPAKDEAAPRGHVIPHPHLRSDTPAIDERHLDRLRQLDADDGFLAEVIRDFIVDAEQLVTELEAAAQAVDAAAFRDRAHALRSSAAHLGATALFELCLGWRGISAAELADTGRIQIARLKVEFERLRTALMSFAEDTPPEDSPAVG